MSFSLSEAMTRLNSLKFNAQEKGQLKAQLMKLNSEQLQFLFEDDEEVVIASLYSLLGDSNKQSNRNGPTNLNNVNNLNTNNPPNNGPNNNPKNDPNNHPNNNGAHSNNNNNNAPKCRNFNTCQKYCYPNPNGGYYDYCGKTCRMKKN